MQLVTFIFPDTLNKSLNVWNVVYVLELKP